MPVSRKQTGVGFESQLVDRHTHDVEGEAWFLPCLLLDPLTTTRVLVDWLYISSIVVMACRLCSGQWLI